MTTPVVIVDQKISFVLRQFRSQREEYTPMKKEPTSLKPPRRPALYWLEHLAGRQREERTPHLTQTWVDYNYNFCKVKFNSTFLNWNWSLSCQKTYNFTFELWLLDFQKEGWILPNSPLLLRGSATAKIACFILSRVVSDSVSPLQLITWPQIFRRDVYFDNKRYLWRNYYAFVEQ